MKITYISIIISLYSIISMNMAEKLIMGWVSFPKIDSARKVAKLLITSKLAGCTKIINNMESFYEWEGKLEEDNEVYVVIKTTQNKVDEIQKLLKENHPNKVYEFIYTSIEGGNPDYMDWVRKATGSGNKIDV